MKGDAPTVAVLGGGIGGLTAAHELAERGFDVTVYEAAERFGGKARSVPVPAVGGPGGPTLYGEHGFRFFPAYYRHVTDTMRRVPFPGNDRGVYDNLVPTRETLVAAVDGPEFTSATERPRTAGEWLRALRPGIGGDEVPRAELRHFLSRLVVLLSSCEARRRTEYDRVSWWEFIDAASMSPAYRKHLARSTQALVALRPEDGSARTIGVTYLQLLRGQVDPSTPAERILDGPTSEAWIAPWVDHLDELGVDLRPGAPVRAIHSDGRRVTGVTVGEDVGESTPAGVPAASGGTSADADGRLVTADHYVAALPVEVMADLCTPALRRAAPSLAGLDRIETAWMNGVQFFLAEDAPLAAGHQVYADSPWALTAISQRQFWDRVEFADRGDGRVAGVLSVIVSDWETPGVVYGKPARECTREEIAEEVWTQLRAHLNRGEERLPDGALVDWTLDPAIVHDADGVRNEAPLVVNTVGSLRHRPAAATEAPNLTLAADYVRTHTDLATMEAANEAARRAVNAVVDRSDTDAPRCGVWPLREPRAFAPLKRQDARRYRLGLPPPGETARPLGLLLARLGA